MVLIGGIAHHPFGHPTIVALVPATSLEPSIPGPVQLGRPVFRRMVCLPILPAAAVPVFVCPSAGLIDFAPADSVAVAIVVVTDFAWTVVASDSVGSAGFVVAVVAAGSVV